MTRRWALSVICAAYGLLLLAWVFSTPPFGAPDEAAHYLRAGSIADGRLLGPKVPVTAPTAQQTAFIEHDARGTYISAELAPPDVRCVDGRPVPITGRCLVASYEGNFEPLPYLLPALAFKTSGHANGVLWRGRLASALPALVFIVLAFALLWSESIWSLVGLFAAVTPTALFVDSVINPNGLELAANMAFVAGLLRIARSRASASGWVVATTAASGATSILAWQLGWVFVCVELVVVALLLGTTDLRRLVAERRRQIGLAAGVLIAAFALYLAYGLHADLLHGDLHPAPLGPGLQAGVTQLRNDLFGSIGLFGFLDVALPSDAYYWIWFVVVLGLLGGGLFLGTGRERVATVVGSGAALVFTVLFYAWVQRNSGFGLQPRHVMPLLALMPMLGGELIFRHRERLPKIWRVYVPGVIVSLIAVFQLFAWWINARTSALRPGALWFLHDPGWSPPHGWLIWTSAAAAGSALLLVFAVSGARAEPATRGGRRYDRSSSEATTASSPGANASSSRHIERHTRSI